MRLRDIYKQIRSSWDYGTFSNSSDPYESMGQLQNNLDSYETKGHLQTVQIIMRLLDIYKQVRSLCD